MNPKGPVKQLKIGSHAYINVPVALLWKEAQLQRDLDHPSLSDMPDIRTWLSSLTYEQRLWLVGKVETQVLLGTKVRILDSKEKWVKIAVSLQPTHKNTNGYPGWLLSNQLNSNGSFYETQGDFIRISKSPTTWLYDSPHLNHKVMEISFNTKLAVIKKSDTAVSVQLPSEKLLWLNIEDVCLDPCIKPLDGLTIYETGTKFLGLPYLWGGMSGFGFDCSGFVHSIHQYHGITIPRDASEQAQQGTIVEKDKLEIGDVIFFAYEKGKGSIHHVGIYAGEGKLLHAPKTGLSIEEIDLWKTSPYSEEFSCARRYV